MVKFYRICLEGNIGCGKTSLLDNFINEFKSKIINKSEDFCMIKFQSNVSIITNLEPIKQWTNIGQNGGENLLKKMYSDPKRWAFTFEHYSQITRFKQMSSLFENDNFNNNSDFLQMHLMERSLFSNRFTFVENFYKTGKLSFVEYKILDEWFEYLRKKPETFVNLFIYLRTYPEVVQERIRKRSRSEEDLIPIDYLQQIHELHEKCFAEKHPSIWNRMPKSSEVILIDANNLFDSVYEIFTKVITNIIQQSLKIH